MGSSITGFNGTVTLEISPGALATDTVIFGTNTTSSKPGSFVSINLRPDGTTFSPSATLKWSYDGIDLGNINPLTLTIYTYDGESWLELPTMVDTQAKLVIAEVTHFSSFSMGSAPLTGTQVGLSHTYPGNLNVPILDLAITNTDGAVADTLDYIHVVSNCTDNLDVAGVSLWNDTNDNAAIDGADVQVGITQALAGGNTNFTGISEIIPASTTLNVLVALDVAATATIGNYLDLLIPMNAVGLTNAGLNLEAVDPAGNTTINQELATPHEVYGNVSNILGLLPYAWVNVTNNRTGSVENIMADSLGRYNVDLGIMLGGYNDTDEIYIVANDTLGQTGFNVTFVDVAMFGEQCDIYIGKGPIASNETPPMGSTITDIYQNITLNITSASSSVNISTIILEVEGLNYTIADGNLTFSGDTLVFNTSKAFGNWTNGQVINVTLWVANDTIGNPCENAPYVWWFNISSDLVTEAPEIKVHKQGNDINITWQPVANATSYSIYRSTAINGTGFNWSVTHGTSTETYFIDSGALSDNNNYSYIVKGENIAGKGPSSNIGWKLIKQLVQNAATSSINWLALPYNSDLIAAQDLIDDIGAANLNYVSRWEVSTQSYQNKFPVGGFNWPITSGEGILINMKNTVNYAIVGSYNSSTAIDIINNVATSSINWVSLPYHSALFYSQDLIDDIGSSDVNYISRWIVSTQSYQNKFPIGGFNWPLTPGEPVLVNAKNTIPGYTLGPVNNP